MCSNGKFVALCKPTESVQGLSKIGDTECRALMDSGSSVSLIADAVVRRIKGIKTTSAGQSLLTASGNRMHPLGQVELEITIGNFRTIQMFMVASTVITDCILGVDFLAAHRINLDFANRVASGPNFGSISFSDFRSSESKAHLCPAHEYIYPEIYAAIKSTDSVDEEEWECHGVVPDYVELPTIEYPDSKTEFVDIIEEFLDLFAATPGVAKVEPFPVRTGDAAPVKLPPRMVPQAYQQEMQSQIKEMLRKNIIKISSSPWLAPPVLVGKKDGSFRFCIDYRNLNRVTQKDAYPLPLSDQVQDKLSGMKYFTKLDLNSGYWQIPVRDADREKTAFSPGPGMGLYEFNVLPFGLTGGPSYFQRVMDQVLRGFEDCNDNFIDDILVFSRDLESHRTALRKIFQRLREANFTLRGRKCEIGKQSITYLEHAFSEMGMSPQTSKVEYIANWPKPGNLKELKQFLGLANYYRRYIDKFASIAEPLNSLLAKDVTYLWNEEADVAFKKLKCLLSSKPVLKCPNFIKKFTLCTDASGTGLGAVLEQEGHVVAYYSRSLRNAEKHYSTIELECLAIVESVKRFRHYLLGKKFEILTDHKPLEWLAKQKSVGRLWRWAVILQEYDFEIRYRQGSDNENADALSRSLQFAETDERQSLSNDELCALTELTCMPSMESIRSQQLNDTVLGKVLYELEMIPTSQQFTRIEWNHPWLKRYKQISTQLQLVNGVLVRNYKIQPFSNLQSIIVAPESMKRDLLCQAHDDAGHQGVDRTISRLKCMAFWVRMPSDVHDYVTSCEVCQRAKLALPTKVPLVNTPIGRTMQLV